MCESPCVRMHLLLPPCGLCITNMCSNLRFPYGRIVYLVNLQYFVSMYAFLSFPFRSHHTYCTTTHIRLLVYVFVHSYRVAASALIRDVLISDSHIIRMYTLKTPNTLNRHIYLSLHVSIRAIHI